MPSKPIVGALPTPNPEVFGFHTFTPLTELSAENVQRGEYYQNQSPITTALLGIEGVAGVSVRPYVAYVEKGAMFKWDDIAPKAIGFLVYWHNLHTGDEEVRDVRVNVDRNDLHKQKLTLKVIPYECTCGCKWAWAKVNPVDNPDQEFIGCVNCIRNMKRVG